MIKYTLTLIFFLFFSCTWYTRNHIKDYHELKIKRDINLSGYWSQQRGWDMNVSFSIIKDTLNNETYNVSNLYLGDFIAVNQPYEGVGYYKDSLLSIKFNKFYPVVLDKEIVGIDTLAEIIQFMSFEVEGEECLIDEYIYKNLYTDYEFRDSIDSEIKTLHNQMKKKVIYSEDASVLLKKGSY